MMHKCAWKMMGILCTVIILVAIYIVLSNGTAHPEKLFNIVMNRIPKHITPPLSTLLLKHSPQTAAAKIGRAIPAYVHYVYSSCKVPEQYMPLLKHCMEINPNVTFVLWTDDQVAKTIKANYPQKVYDMFKSYTYGIEKADLTRLFLLHLYGGVYMDMDMECRRSLREALDNITCILDKEQYIQTRIQWDREFVYMNNFMACRPKHKFFEYILGKLKPNDHSAVMTKTGPFFLTKVAEEYMRTAPQNKTDPLSIANPIWFSPRVKNLPELLGFCRHRGRWRLIGCKMVSDYKANIDRWEKTAFLIHRFMNLGYSFAYSAIRKTVDVCKEYPKLRQNIRV